MLRCLRVIFSLFRSANLKLKPLKCFFVYEKVAYLGHVHWAPGSKYLWGYICGYWQRLNPKIATKGNSSKSLVSWVNPEVHQKKRTEKHREPLMAPLSIDRPEMEKCNKKTLADIERYKKFPWAKKYLVKWVVCRPLPVPKWNMELKPVLSGIPKLGKQPEPPSVLTVLPTTVQAPKPPGTGKQKTKAQNLRHTKKRAELRLAKANIVCWYLEVCSELWYLKYVIFRFSKYISNNLLKKTYTKKRPLSPPLTIYLIAKIP